MESAFEWRRYYADERERLGPSHLVALLDAAAPLEMPAGGALVVPHTRLEVTGDQIARAAYAVVASGADVVVAVGVLHGGRRCDAERVAAACAGDPDATRELRGIHREDGMAAEEFSLDAFTVLVELAARRADRTIEVIRRYPFLAGGEPGSLPGLDEISARLADGAALVVTTDPVHHGRAYGSAPAVCWDEHDPDTLITARAAIDAQIALLSEHRFEEFRLLAVQHRSDFRDTGAVMACLLGPGFTWDVHDLALVDYAIALDAASPSWVAGALASVRPAGA